MRYLSNKVILDLTADDVRCLNCKLVQLAEEKVIAKKIDAMVERKFFQKKVKSLVECQGKSLTWLANELGYKRPTFYKKLQAGIDFWTETIEGKPKLKKMLELLNCKIDDLIYKK